MKKFKSRSHFTLPLGGTCSAPTNSMKLKCRLEDQLDELQIEFTETQVNLIVFAVVAVVSKCLK